MLRPNWWKRNETVEGGRCSGFTMIEIMTALLVTAMIISLLVRLQSQGFLNYRRLRESAEAEENLRIADHRINRELHQAVASSLVIDYGGRRICFRGNDGSYGGFRYDPPGREIELRTRDGSNWVPLASGIDRLNFDCRERMVVYSLTAAPPGGVGMTVTGEIYLEN